MSAVILRSVVRSQARTFHTSRAARSAQIPDGSHMPFGDVHGKTKFGLGLTIFCVTGFSVPFIAGLYHMRKSA